MKEVVGPCPRFARRYPPRRSRINVGLKTCVSFSATLWYVLNVVWKAFGMFWGVSVLRSDQEKRPYKVFLSLICWSIGTLTWLSSRLGLVLLMNLPVVVGINLVGSQNCAWALE